MLKKNILLLLLTAMSLKADILDFSTLKADFVQTIVNDQNSTLRYEGTLYVMKPDKILWQYETPVRKSIFITKHNVTVYEPELYQAMIFKQNKELDPIKMLKESTRISTNERISEFNGNRITILHDTTKVKTLSFTDKVDSHITIRFINYEKDTKLDERLFLFEPTDEIDIIRQ